MEGGGSPRSDEPTRFEEVDLLQCSDALDAIVKSAGPFYLPRVAPAQRGYEPPDPKGDPEALAEVPVFIAWGGADLEAGAKKVQDILGT